MMNFTVQYQDGNEWRDKGEAEREGQGAAAQAVGKLAELTGVYRVRPAAAGSSTPWARFSVPLDRTVTPLD